MPIGVTKYGDLTLYQAGKLSKRALRSADRNIVFGKFALSEPLDANSTDTLIFEQYLDFDPATTPLVEGVPVPLHSFRKRDVRFNVRPYGYAVGLSKTLKDLHTDPVSARVVDKLGLQAADTVELLTMGSIIGGLNVFYGNGSVRSDVNTPVSLPLLQDVTRTLHQNGAPYLTQVLGSSQNYSTIPIEAGYVCICSTDLAPDLRRIDGFVPVAKYGSQKIVCNGEIGSIENMRFVGTRIATPWVGAGGSTSTMLRSGGKANVYPMFVFGEEAFVTIPLKGQTAFTPIVMQPGIPRSVSDPLAREGSAGWSTYHGGGILNQGFFVRIEVAAIDLRA